MDMRRSGSQPHRQWCVETGWFSAGLLGSFGEAFSGEASVEEWKRGMFVKGEGDMRRTKDSTIK